MGVPFPSVVFRASWSVTLTSCKSFSASLASPCCSSARPARSENVPRLTNASANGNRYPLEDIDVTSSFDGGLAAIRSAVLPINEPYHLDKNHSFPPKEPFMLRSGCAIVMLSMLCFADAPAGAATGKALDTAKIEEATGAKGKLDEKEGAFKVSVPRTDLNVTAA